MRHLAIITLLCDLSRYTFLRLLECVAAITPRYTGNITPWRLLRCDHLGISPIAKGKPLPKRDRAWECIGVGSITPDPSRVSILFYPLQWLFFYSNRRFYRRSITLLIRTPASLPPFGVPRFEVLIKVSCVLGNPQMP